MSKGKSYQTRNIPQVFLLRIINVSNKCSIWSIVHFAKMSFVIKERERKKDTKDEKEYVC
jgi:hypothetical protein